MSDNIQNKYLNFGFDKDTKKMTHEAIICINWLNSLTSGERAELIRCSTLQEVKFVPAYHHLLYELQRVSRVVYKRQSSLAVIAGTLPYIKENKPLKLAFQMAGSGESTIPISERRLKQLISIEGGASANDDDKNELFERMVSIIKILGGNVNILDVANTIYNWDDYTRKNMMFNYYNKFYDKH